jgi:thioredoxin-related protein
VKKIILILSVCVSFLFGDINWSKDYASALNEAKMANKPMLFIVSKTDCRYCIKLKDITLKDQKVVDELNKNFISAISIFDKGDFVPKELFTPGVPAIWFLLADGTPMFQPLMGYVAPEEMLEAFEIVKEEFKSIKEAK